MTVQDIINDLKRFEGYRTKPYDDFDGKEFHSGKCLKGKLTIGIGRNLNDVGLRDEEIMFLLRNDIQECIDDLERIFPDLHKYPENAVRGLINMRFNLGPKGFRNFKKMIEAIKNQDWKKARDEAIDSRWCNQVGSRCKFIADLLYKEG